MKDKNKKPTLKFAKLIFFVYLPLFDLLGMTAWAFITRKPFINSAAFIIFQLIVIYAFALIFWVINRKKIKDAFNG